MDSRIIRNAIMVSGCMIIIIVLAVIMGNWTDIKKRFGVSTIPGVQEADTGQNEKGQESRQVGSDLSAFLSDESFFNHDVQGPGSMTVSYGRQASLLISSVEKDLRIHIVDVLGNPIEGEEFSVTLEGLGEYRDSDLDGIIYITPLRAGACSVLLNPLEGYRTPAEPAVINIKQKVEYVAINAIDLIILTEDQVDTAKEDFSGKAASTDRDSTEKTDLTAHNENAKLGIDVSKWNKEIDWKKVAGAGVEFAIIRVGYRGYTSGSLIEDPYFEANMKGAANAGIPVGVYFFSQALTPLEAVEEASMVIDMCQDYNLEYPVFLDSESTGGNGRADSLGTEKRTELAVAFLTTVQSAGYEAGIYGARNWFGKQLDMSQLDSFITWLAEYRDIPLYTGYYQLWQYSSKGSVNGIQGNVDLNLSYLR